VRLKPAFLALFICLIVFQPVFAEPVRLAADEGLMGRFSQTRFLEGFEKPIISEGQFYLLPGKALIWKTEKPFKTFMVVDNEGISQSIAGKEVSKLSISRFPALAVLRDVLEDSLSGNWEPLERMTGSKIIKNANSWRLEFVPATSEMTLPFAALSFEMTNYLDKVEISKGEKDRDVIIFFDQQKALIGFIREAANKAGRLPFE
jgi:hypothetical protein